MASFRYDTELMTNMVSAMPVAAGTTFSTFLHPTTRRPVVLGVSSDKSSKLQLIAEDAEGHRRLYDLGEKLGIPAGTIQNFTARQDSDLKIFMVVAFKADDTTSKILIPKPFSLGSLENIPKHDVRSMSTVETLFMGPVATAGEWPLIVAAHKRFDRFAGGSDLSRILVSGDQWQELQQFHLPENASSIIDVCAGSSPSYGSGIWVLYVIQNQTSLLGIFADRDRHGRITYQNVQPNCPADATVIESYVVNDSETALLIGAREGLYVLNSENSITDHADSLLISSDDVFKSPLRFEVAQDGSNLTIWSVGEAEDLGYIRCQTSLIEQGNLTSTLLMPCGRSTGFSATISRPDSKAGLAVVTQDLVSKDIYGNLAWLQQNTDTGIWKTEPFVVSHQMEVYEVQSYTISITAVDQDKHPVADGTVKVTADSTVQAWVNGRLTNISSDGTRLRLDSSGELGLIISTSGIAGRVLVLEDLRDRDNKALAAPQQSINPSLKVMAAFSSINADTDLSNLKTKTGQPLYASSDDKPSGDDLRRAATCFGQLNNAIKEISSGKSSSLNNMTTLVSNKVATLGNVGDAIMDGFYYLYHKAKDAYNWVVEKVGDAWTFVCEIAGAAKRFVLDCVEKIGEAAMWVWDKIKLGINKLIEYAGFLFNWGDIKATKITIAGFLNAGFAYGNSQLTTLEGKIENFFGNLETKLDQGQSAKQIGSVTTSDTAQQDDKTIEAQNNPGFKWVLERLKNGGASTGTSFAESTFDGAFTGAQSFYEIMKPIGEAIMEMVKDVAKNLGYLFMNSQDLSAGELWAKLSKDFLRDGLRVVKAIVLSLVQLGGKLLAQIEKICKRTINIPVISGLWKKISGEELSLFDAISLVLGIMVCVLSKIITGSAPPTFSNLNASFIGDLVAGKTSAEVRRDLAKFGSVLTLNVAVLTNLFSEIQFFTRGSAHSVEKLTPGTAVLVLKSLAGILGLIAAYPTDPKLPGYEVRQWTVYMGCFSIGSSVLFTLSPLGGADANKKLEIFNCVISIVNFGLYNAIYASELDEAAQFEGKDTEISSLGIVENVFTTVVVAGRCVAINTVDGNVAAAAIALGVMIAANKVLAVNKGLTLKRTLAIQSQSTRGVAGPL